MRKAFASLVFLLTLLAPAGVLAQGFIPAQAPPWIFADNYGRWAIQSQLPNQYTFYPAALCRITELNYGDSKTFGAFASNVGFAPVFIDDVNGANAEVVTPTTAFGSTQVNCGVNLSPANNHTTFTLQSGTGGLQEAINAEGVPTKPYPTVIYLTPEWYKLITGISSLNSTLASITPASVIAAAKGSVTAIVVDVTTAPPSNYVWKGAAGYVSGTQYWKQSSTPPTVAVGAGAGTSPTIAISGNSVTGTVTLTTGSAVPAAADPVFTLTWPSPGTAGSPTSGFQYAATCTYTSTGTVTGAGTASSVIGPPVVATFTSLAAGLTSSTAGYQWTYLCH